MQKLLFSGLLGSNAPEATPKFYPLLCTTIFTFGRVENEKKYTNKILNIREFSKWKFSHKDRKINK